MQRPTVSVIIPAYNEEKYIGDCLEALLRYARSDLLEILVVDNASTDRTGAIAAGYEAVRVIREERKGVTRARQRGFVEARGELLAFLDADTRIQEKWSAELFKKFGADPSLACLSGPYVYYDFPPLLRLFGGLQWNILAPIFAWMFGYMALAGNMVLPRTVLEKMGGFDTTIEFYGDDTDTARRARAFGRVQFSPWFYLFSSGRRFRNQGMINTAVTYARAFFSEALFHRPPSSKAEDWR